jgi:pimeloyl-ACP methyl ester carboxylesterase
VGRDRGHRVVRDIETPALSADTFAVNKREVADGIEIAYLHEGVGGVPIVLLHGWPGTKRLWWRNVKPLAEAGFEVIVPDARGFGDSTVPGAREEFADLPTSATDVHTLLTSLGHERAVLVGGDFGSGVVQDLTLRFPGFTSRQAVFNGLSPVLDDLYHEHGIPGSQLEEVGAVTDHMEIQGNHADELAAELDTPEKRVDYVKGFYQGRVWKEGEPWLQLGGAGNIDDAGADFMAAAFADADVFRSSLGYYESVANPELAADAPRLMEPNEKVKTMILYGVEDDIVGPNYTARMELAHHDHVGPFLVEDAGHFLQWERADVLNNALISFCSDLLA